MLYIDVPVSEPDSTVNRMILLSRTSVLLMPVLALRSFIKSSVIRKLWCLKLQILLTSEVMVMAISISTRALPANQVYEGPSISGDKL